MANFCSDGRECIARSVPAPPLHAQPIVDDMEAELEIYDICRWINKNGFTKVCLQFPDNLLKYSANIYKSIKLGTLADVYILGDTTYSNCCVDEVAAMHVQADAIVHYGHTCFSASSIPVFTVLPRQTINVEMVMKPLQNLKGLGASKQLCLFYDAAYHHMRDQISNIWYDYYPNGCIALVNVKKCEERVVGRCITNKNGKILKVEEIEDFSCVYLGNRSQTLFNCVISIKAQDWYCLEFFAEEVNKLDETPWFKRRRYLIEKIKDAQNIGILVCKLSGQSTKDIIMRMKGLCKISHKKSYIVSVGKPNVAKLANFPEIDVYVMIACPENDLYNSRDFYKPLVYPYELEVALNSNRSALYNTHIPDFEDLLHNNRGFCPIGDIKANVDMSLITGKLRETKLNNIANNVTDIEKINWAVESIGQSLSQRTWTGLEQNLGDTEVRKAEEGRSGLPISYDNEPKP